MTSNLTTDQVRELMMASGGKPRTPPGATHIYIGPLYAYAINLSNQRPYGTLLWVPWVTPDTITGSIANSAPCTCLQRTMDQLPTPRGGRLIEDSE